VALDYLCTLPVRLVIVAIQKDGSKGKSVFHDVGESVIQENDLILVAGFKGNVLSFTDKFSQSED